MLISLRFLFQMGHILINYIILDIIQPNFRNMYAYHFYEFLKLIHIFHFLFYLWSLVLQKIQKFVVYHVFSLPGSSNDIPILGFFFSINFFFLFNSSIFKIFSQYFLIFLIICS